MNEIRPSHLRNRVLESYRPNRFSRLRFIAALLTGCLLGIGIMAGYQYWKRKVIMPSNQSGDGWNRSAIEAKFALSVKGKGEEVILFYSLRNNTAQDYTLDEECSPTLVFAGGNKQLLAVPDLISVLTHSCCS